MSDTNKFYETQVKAAKDAVARGDMDAAAKAIGHACVESAGRGTEAVNNGLDGLNAAAERIWGKKR